MIKKLFNLDLGETVSGAHVYLRHSWIFAALLLAGLVAYVIYLYRSEPGLSRQRRIVMGTCYALAGLLLIVMLIEPMMRMTAIRPLRRTVLVLLDTSQSMSIADDRREAPDVMEAAKVLQKIPLDAGAEPPKNQADRLKKELAGVSRLDLAKAAVTHPEIDLPGKLGEDYTVRFFTLGDRLEPITGEGETAEWLEGQTAEAKTSRIGSAIEEAVGRHAGQPIAGVVLLSDFAWLEGRDPVDAARRMKKDRGIPIYTVGIGLPSPPDVHVRRLIAPKVAFTGDKVPLRVHVDSSGFDDRTVQLALKIDGMTADTREVTLTGGVQFEEFTFIPKEKSGSAEIEVSIEPLAGETSEANNAASHKVQIIDEKINVLYVEGMPRWEYRYLRRVLLRDHRLNVMFLMTQGDQSLAQAPGSQYLRRFPVEAKEVLQYDLVILGDVPSSYFTTDQVSLIEKLVKERGGSLLMLAGPTAAPSTYTDTRIADMLPVKIAGGPWTGVDGKTHPVVTADGYESSVVSLTGSKQLNNRIWAAVRPMGYLPKLAGAKRGATVLLTLPETETDKADYPLVAWQRYRTGKTMFVGTADLWRLRREVGDQYHARFWGQAIQFLALSRLLGQNKQITLETGQGEYAAGEHVDVFANVLTESFEPVDEPSYDVLLERDVPGALPTELELNPVPGSPGLYGGLYLAEEEGTYILKAKEGDRAIANTAKFAVKNVPLELRETAMREDLAEQVAALSGGKHLAAADLGSVPELLETDEELWTTIQKEKDLWDMPAMFILLVVITGIEWYMRRRENMV